MALPQSAHVVAHWSASDLALADNAPVTSWVDSVNSIAATQGTGAKQPVFKTGIYGGKPCVRFDGSNDVLSIATPGAMATAINTQTFSVMIVFQKIANTANTYGNLFHYSATVDGSDAFYICDNNRIHRYPMRSGYASIPFTTNNVFSSFGNTSGVGGGLALTALEREFINGGCVMSSILKKAPGGTTSSFEIGANDVNGFYANADIFEVIVWDVELTPPEVAQFHDWACTTYSQATPWSSKSSFVVFDGDSICAGTGVGEDATSGTQADSYPYVAAQSLGLSYGQWSNIGIGYMTMPQMTSKAATDLLPYATITGKSLKIAAFEWYNQRAATPTPANNSLSYLSTVRSSTTKVAFGTSTDSNAGAPEPTYRTDYDNYFDANHTSSTMDAYVALHTATHVGPEGSVTTYPTYFCDGLHPTALGYAEIAGLFVTGLNSITFNSSSVKTFTFMGLALCLG